MQEDPEVAVLRLGHRPGRDDRMTTHVGLTARALGADRVIYPDNATDAVGTVEDITDRFGGPFAVETAGRPLGELRDWEGRIVHLTMYGERLRETIDDVREDRSSAPLLVVVGSEKVSYEVYERADWNLGVTNQPHSEVAALAVFLDRLFEGRELDREWEDAERRVVPMAEGKRMVDVGDGDDGE